MYAALRADADTIIRKALRAVAPDAAVAQALSQAVFPGRIILVAAGKAAWQMAKAADACLGARITRGVVITKYHHSMGPIAHYDLYEAGHPVPDESSFAATRAALVLVKGLTATDTVLFLLSGGGSALFEQPLISGTELADINAQLLSSGADIMQINTIRKRLSAVKGGRFAELCRPARVFSVVLSDILGDPLDMIASGPACADPSTCEMALAIADRYGLSMSPQAWQLLHMETVKKLDNVTTCVTGSVRELCHAAAQASAELGYEPILLTDRLCCEAREAGSFLGSILHSHHGQGRAAAFIAGGETIVHVRGSGKGGRNQELALAAAKELDGLGGAAVFSLGSDGTDGPTDAAGGYVDGSTAAQLRSLGLSADAALRDNDAYPVLQAVGGLLMTGPTGTNVNDLSVGLLRPTDEG